VERVLELYRQGYRVVLDADIKGFFDNLSHQAVMREVSAVVADGNILRLIEKFLRAGVLEGGDVLPTRIGTPQGGVISPLLANIALNVLDQHLEQRGCRFVRYADDFIVLCRARAEAEEVLSDIRPLLAGMGLELSPEKTVVRCFQEGFDFLGFRITRWSVKMRTKKVEAFKAKVRSLTRRSYNLDATVIGKLNAVIRGTANYFAREWSACGDMYRSLDRWIRMRLRCMKFKRKHNTDNWRLRLKHLKNMGLISLTDLIPKASG
jgi:group II intron reverse transcriptase/maturase